MAKDPYQYFRIEARELLDALGRGVLDLEKGVGAAEVIVRLLRAAHTLKGAARVVKQSRIAELAHAVEDVLAPHDGGAQPATTAVTEELLRLIDEIAARIDELDPAPAIRTETLEAPLEQLRNVRVDLDEMDALLDDVSEVDVRLTVLRRYVVELERSQLLAGRLANQLTPQSENELAGEAMAARLRPLAEELSTALAGTQRELLVAIDRADREMARVRDKANQLRLLPASSIFSALERAARDASHSLQRPIRFAISGGEQRLEANVLAAMRDSLLHVVRNAVAHGIEPGPERRARGKPAVGQVSIEVERRDQRLVFICRDDGNGIDTEAVRRAAVARGAIGAAEAAALADDQVMRLILRGGVTTAATLTELSGRGVGLDAVQSAMAHLGGAVTIESERGRGTTIILSVPISLSSLLALVVQAGDVTASLPLDAVQRAARITAGDIAASAEHDAIMVDGQAIAFLPLATALRRALPPSRRAEPWSVVVVHAGEQVAAIGVDRVLSSSQVVLRALPRLAGEAPSIIGASLDADGNPQLVLNPQALVRAAQAGRGAIADIPAVRRLPVLIIDDSLTTRMLEQSILESAGYEVHLATSAEEGLELARQRRYSLFIVDVEMPGMSGFEFLETTRGDATLRDVPAILVSSRSGSDDKERGARAGARGYIVKGEFHQGRLLETIRGLVG